MNLKGTNIDLRALEPSDLEVLYAWENNPEIWQVSNTMAPFSKFVLEQYLLNAHEDIIRTRQIRLMICGKTNMPLGTIELFDLDIHHSRVGIGVFIDKEAENKGYASEAIQLLCQYCFEVLLVRQVYCNVSAANTRSLHLFKKNGFVEAGLKKQWNKTSQQHFEDEWLLQLIKF